MSIPTGETNKRATSAVNITEDGVKNSSALTTTKKKGQTPENEAKK